jgi:uncharacterized membrane protein YidH (DUF202 family)
LNPVDVSIEIPEPEKKKKGDKKVMQLEKVRLSTEKLQLSRVRASLTLMALGFASYKFFYARMQSGQEPLLEFFNGRDLGMIVLSIALGLLIFGTVQHRKSIAALRLRYPTMQYSVSLIISYFILALDLTLLLVMIFRA